MRTAPLFVALVLTACSSQEPPPSVNDRGPTAPLPPAGAIDAGSLDAGRSRRALDAGEPTDADEAAATKLDALQCALFVPSGVDVAETRVASDPPQPTGGPVMLGYYELSAVRIYTGQGGESGPTGRTLEQTMYLDGIDFQDVRIVMQGMSGLFGEPVYAGGTYVSNGLTITFKETCQGSSTSSIPYSSDGRTLKLYEGNTERELDFR